MIKAIGKIKTFSPLLILIKALNQLKTHKKVITENTLEDALWHYLDRKKIPKKLQRYRVFRKLMLKLTAWKRTLHLLKLQAITTCC